MNSTPVERPIFVVGPGRSGTTLLRSLLSAHSRISIAPETHFMDWAEKEGGLETGAPADVQAFWQKYTSSTRFKDLGVDVERCRELISREDPSFRSIFVALLTAYAERASKPRVGEKTPRHIYFLSLLLRWFPAARVLILQRDPRAVIASQLRTPWVSRRITPLSLRGGVLTGSRLSEVVRYADDWARTYEEVVPEWQNDPRVLAVAFELLVQDAERELRRVCSFIEEPYEPTMLTGRTSETVPLPAATAGMKDGRWQRWRREHHARTFQPISPNPVRKWQSQLTTTEVSMIEGCCFEAMIKSGYEMSLSAPRRSAGRLLADTIRTMQPAERVAREKAAAALRPVRAVIRKATRPLAP